MKTAFAILILLAQISASSLYFYLQGREQKCFYEELSHGLQVMGQFSTTSLDVSNNFSEDNGIKVHNFILKIN
jgi:hypothetical protein